MKKIAILLMTFVMFCSTSALSESLDLTVMSLDELVRLNELIRDEIAKRIDFTSDTTIGRGTYIAGETILEGTYDFVCLESGVFDETGYVNNAITVTTSSYKETFRASKISVGGHVTFTLNASDTLQIAGCSGTIVKIENPTWVP